MLRASTCYCPVSQSLGQRYNGRRLQPVQIKYMYTYIYEFMSSSHEKTWLAILLNYCATQEYRVLRSPDHACILIDRSHRPYSVAVGSTVSAWERVVHTCACYAPACRMATYIRDPRMHALTHVPTCCCASSFPPSLLFACITHVRA